MPANVHGRALVARRSRSLQGRLDAVEAEVETELELVSVGADLVAPNGLVMVDATYGLPYDELTRTPGAWPATYRNARYPEVFAGGSRLRLKGVNGAKRS